jgi:ABC-type branched-subunit amino acid transport system ATPase component
MKDNGTANNALLKVTNLTKAFGGLRAIDNVSFEVPARAIYGLIGPNGSGKTTTYNVITGFHTATEGHVIFRGEDITNTPPNKTARKGLMRTFQLVRVFPEMTVLENMLMGAQPKHAEAVLQGLLRTHAYRRERGEILERAMQLLDVVGLSSMANHLTVNLPFAEQKMVEITRAVMSKPDMILLDEPTSGILKSTADRILDYIRYLREEQGKTFMIIEHNMRVIMNICDRIIVLNAGRKIAEGTPKEVGSNRDVIRAYLGE